MAKSSKTKAAKDMKTKPAVASSSTSKAAAPTKSKPEKAAAPVVQENPKSKGKGKEKAKVVVEEVVKEDEDDSEEEEVAAEKPAASSDVDAPNDSDSEEEESDEDDDGVDEEGMERLLKALGDEGLDDFDKSQINQMAGVDDDEEESDDEEGSGDEESDAEGSGDEEEEVGEKGAASKSSDAEAQDEEDEEDEDEDEAAVPLDEGDMSVDEDAVPTRKVEIDNTVALERIRKTIALDSSLPWTETLTVTYPHTIDVDVNDDLNREVAFYKQALHTANEARALAAKHKFPFTRPADYFAEMVKSDSHMERIRIRMLNETAAIKQSEDKRKQREGKKFGKQVQIEKLKEREKSKKDMEEKIKGLKRKRKDMLSGDGETGNDDAFDVEVENALADKPASRANKRPKVSREARDKKYGFGGAGRHSKSNTRDSTDDFGGRGGGGKARGGFGGGKRGGGAGGKKTQRPGKSKRHSSRK